MISRNFTRTATFLGLTQAFLWAFQHPFESLLYHESRNSELGIFEGALYSKAFGVAFMVVFILVPGVPGSIAKIVRERRRLLHLPVCVLFGLGSLSLYAYGQSRMDGVLVSLVISVSPFTYVLATVMLRNSPADWPGKFLEFFRSDYFKLHVLFLAILIAAFLAFPPIQSAELHWLSVLAVAFVPMLFFLSFNQTAAFAQGSGLWTKVDTDAILLEDYFAAAVIVSVASLIVLSLGTSAYSLSVGVSLNPMVISATAWTLFFFSCFVSGFLGHMFHYWNLRRKPEALGEASLYHPLIPAMSAIMGAALAIFAGIAYKIHGFYLVAAALISVVLFVKGFYEKKPSTEVH